MSASRKRSPRAKGAIRAALLAACVVAACAAPTPAPERNVETTEQAAQSQPKATEQPAEAPDTRGPRTTAADSSHTTADADSSARPAASAQPPSSPISFASASSANAPPDLVERISRAASQLSGTPHRDARVEFDSGALGIDAKRVIAVAAERHGPRVEIIELDASRTPPRLRIVRSSSEPKAVLEATPVPLESIAIDIDLAVATRVLERVRFALAAKATLESAAASGNQIHVQSLTMTSSNPWLAFELSGPANARVVRTFNAYLMTDTAPDYAPLSEAWNELTTIRPTLTQGARLDLADLVARAWQPDFSRPPWSLRRMLALAAALPSTGLVPQLLPNLKAEPPIATLTVNALAAASGNDLRRDASGAARPLAAITTDYQRLFQAGAIRKAPHGPGQ